MRVLVVGAGAVGGYFGGCLARAGRDVMFLVRPRRTAEIAARGFGIHSVGSNPEAIEIRTIASNQIETAYDLVLLSCKAYDLDGAIADFASAVGPETTILPLLNGIQHVDALSKRFGAERVVGGLCAISARLNENGHVVLLGRTPSVTFGEWDGGRSRRIDAIAATLSDSGFDTKVSVVIQLEMWEKWVLLAALAGITCLMRGSVGDIVGADAGDLTEILLEECRQIAAAQGQIVRPQIMERMRATLTQAGSPFTASMLRDLERGGRIEAEHVIGDLLRRRSDSASPSCSLLEISYAHLKAYEVRQARERLSLAT